MYTQARRSLLAFAAVLAVSTPIASSGSASAAEGGQLSTPRTTALERRAAAYIRFREDIAAIEARGIEDSEATRAAHRLLSAHDPKALSDGFVAYAALVAADTPEFVDALREDLGNRRRREALLQNLRSDPYFIRNYPAAQQALAAVSVVAMRDARRVIALGESFKESAYSMQRTDWGQRRLPESASRLQEARAFAAGRAAPRPPVLSVDTEEGVTAPTLASAPAEWSADWAGETSVEAGAIGSEAIVSRILNLAARYAIGEISEPLVDVYAKNDRANRCLDMRDLVLDQCMAATRTPYEEAFCLGEHGLIDVSNCMVEGAAGAS